MSKHHNLGRTYDGTVSSGMNNANIWLDKFNLIYQQKTKMQIFPGSLNIKIKEPMKMVIDSEISSISDAEKQNQEPNCEVKIVAMRMDEYGGQRDILMMPCILVLNSGKKKQCFIWRTTNADKGKESSNKDHYLLELITDTKLRDPPFSLKDGDSVQVILGN